MKKLNSAFTVAIAIVMLVILFGVIMILPRNGNSWLIPGNTDNSTDQGQGNNENLIDFQFTQLEKEDVSELYDTLSKEFEVKKEKQYDPQENQVYSLGEVYDLNSRYVGKSNILSNFKLSDLDLPDYWIRLSQSYIDSSLQNIVDQYQIIDYDLDHEVTDGDVVVLSIYQSVDGVGVDYIPGGFIQCVVGEDYDLINGLRDIIVGHKVGYQVKFNGTAPEGTTVKRSDNGETIDISGKAVEFDLTISWAGYEATTALSDIIVKDYAEMKDIEGIETVDDYVEYLVYNHAWQSAIGYSSNYVANLLSQVEEDDITISPELQTHLNLVVQSVDDGYDYSGKIYTEFLRVQTAEFYNSLYEQLPAEYKTDVTNDEQIHSLLVKAYGGEFGLYASGVSRTQYPNEEQYADFIRKLQVLNWYIDNTDIQPMDDSLSSAESNTSESSEPIEIYNDTVEETDTLDIVNSVENVE